MGDIDIFTKVDLHIHSYISKYKEPPGIVDNSTKSNLDVLFEKLEENKINMFAFSDHNRFDKDLFIAAKELIKNKKYPNVKSIIPSVEFDVQIDSGMKSCHILAVFDYEDKIENLDKLCLINNNSAINNKNDFYQRREFENLLKDIGLSVILIACQRSDFKNDGGANSISHSTNNIEDFLKIGYISALEFQKPSVEGILKNSLHEIDSNIATVAGSDCHEWKSYPLHDSNSSKNNKAFYFVIKAQPTFMGLLLSFTSPETRFNRQTSLQSHYIREFNINSEEIPLSYGINAIIGENGSGKSTLLSYLASVGKLENYQKKLISINKISKSFNIGDDVLLYIRQGQLTKGDAPNSIFKENFPFPIINHENFDKSISLFSTSLFEEIKANIKRHNDLNKIKNKMFIFDIDCESFSSYFMNIQINEKDSKPNKYKKPLGELNEILMRLKNTLNNNLFSEEQIKLLRSSYKGILAVRNDLAEKYREVLISNKILNLAISGKSKYDTNIDKLKSSLERSKSEYMTRKKDFSLSISNLIHLFWHKKSLSNFKISIPKDDGKSQEDKSGYTFVSKFKYSDESSSDLLDDFLRETFNSKYQSLDALSKVIDDNELNSAIKKVGGKDKVEDIFALNVERFKKNHCIEEKSIYDSKDTVYSEKIGQTLGEKSLVYLKLVTSVQKDYELIALDQTEDNISNRRIICNLLNYINKIRDKTQIILVTHNPLLVINLDVDNVVYLEKRNDIISIKSGPLEDKKILSAIANEMDGGLKEIERRLKLYEN